VNDPSAGLATIPPALAALLGRRSVSPRRLTLPGPSPADVDLMLQAALRAPNHGARRPWRVIEFPLDQRAALADLFEQEKLRRDVLASAEDRARAREHALRPPALLGFIAAPRRNARIPSREQWLGAGAALGNLLNVAHALGYGAIVLSGERCFDEELLRRLGVQPDEALVGFVSIGSIREAPPTVVRQSTDTVRSFWQLRASPRSDVESGAGT
jgi:nitroreductase